MARSWCKVSASLDSHPKIRRAGNLGRQVFEFALRRNAELDRNGVVPAEHLESEYLADVLMLTKEQAVSGLSQCVRTGLLALDTGNYVITGWDDEWGKRPMTEAERKRNQRANQRGSSSVTKCPDSSVTESDSPECHGSEERRGDQKRGEEKRDHNVAEPLARQRKSPKSAGPSATPDELASVTRVLERLTKANGIAYRGADQHVRLIVNQLRAGVSELELRAVIAHCEEQWESKPDMRQYLRPETLFGPQTIARYLDPARTRYARELAQLEPQTTLEVVR